MTKIPNKDGILIAESPDWRKLYEEKTVTVGSDIVVRINELEDKVISPEVVEHIASNLEDINLRLSTLEKVVGVFYSEYMMSVGPTGPKNVKTREAYEWFMKKWVNRGVIRAAKKAVVKRFFLAQKDG